jgi:hypothetical protein
MNTDIHGYFGRELLDQNLKLNTKAVRDSDMLALNFHGTSFCVS